MDIEKKALELVNAVRIERGFPPSDSIEFDDSHWDTAFYRAIEAHEADNARHAAEMEAFKREVSEAVEAVIDATGYSPSAQTVVRQGLARFITPQPDPLVEAFSDIGTIDPNGAAKDLRAALAARGLELVKKEPSQ